MKLFLHSFIVLFLLLFLTSCGDRQVEVKVTNKTGKEVGVKLIELPAPKIFERLESKAFYITNVNDEEIPSQLTHDSLILFAVDIPVDETQIFKVHPSDSLHYYPPTVWGQLYPRRRDDLSYENELVGFRIYGPGTQKAGEKAFGYDIFFKHPTEKLVIPILYDLQTDEANWKKADSLRKIDNALAEEFINSFTYHIDHGNGMDCYAVGPTLGAGVTAILQNDSIIYPWCYDSAEILDNGPLRFTVKLQFPTSFEGNLSGLTENRIISLDSYSFLNYCRVWFEGTDNPLTLVTGFPLRDDSKPVVEIEKGLLAYSDPTQGESNGKALLGVRIKEHVDSVIVKDNHILLVSNLNPSDIFEYKWGFSWDKTEIPNMDEWKIYLKNTNLNYTVEIK